MVCLGPGFRHVTGDGVDTYGIVVSSGPVIASGTNGGNRVIVNARLPDGELIHVSTMNGDNLTIRQTIGINPAYVITGQ